MKIIVLRYKLIFFMFLIAAIIMAALSFTPNPSWSSQFIQMNSNGTLQYIPDDKGNTIPDFSRVGYEAGDIPIPDVAIVTTIAPSATSQQDIQAAIDQLSRKQPGKNGFRGTILLKKGIYPINGSIHINASGIVLRGEGDNDNGTKLIATTKQHDPVISVSGKGNISEVNGSRTRITDEYVPTGTHSFSVADAQGFKTGDRIIVYRPGTAAWIHDLKMDQIVERPGTKQWQANEYNFRFERTITNITGNKIFIDNPVVMAMETKYGGGEIFKYNFEGRIQQVGIENIGFESEYESDTSENHSWDAIVFNKIENGWIRHVTARHFAYSCVNLGEGARNISVVNSNCYDHKSVITGGRRYSFCNNGQLNLFMDCHTTDGRHDFVTGARTCGPNVFVNCTAKKTHADIGPHHRWSMGTLYDNINTDGEINVQDRGNMGSGHGWVGTTQVIWNCTVRQAAIQNPYVSGKNYCIGLKGKKVPGHFKNRPDGVWEGQNRPGLQPPSLYLAQVRGRKGIGN